MKSIMLIAAALLASTSVFAKSVNTSSCDESVAVAVINFLEREEPAAELHIVKNENGEVIGLTDANEVFPTIDFLRTMKLSKNKYENVFQYNTVIVYADFAFPSCTVFNIGTAQDDQD